MSKIKRLRMIAIIAVLALIVTTAGVFLLPHLSEKLGGDGEKDLRGELLSLYEENPDGYDRQILGVTGCDRETAEQIAAAVGGTLMMDDRLTTGSILLPDQTDAETAIGKIDDRYLSNLSPGAILYPAELPVDDSFADIEQTLGLDLINFGDLWSVTAGKTDAKRVKIAVVDSGIDWSHPELAGRISEESYSVPLGKSVREANGDWSILDATGTPHGTKVSSVIMAAANNAAGIAGIAYDCEFVFIKLTDTGGKFNSAEMMAGIEYAAKIGCDVVNLSLGNNVTIPGCDSVVNQANNAGCVVVCAAGNDTSEVPHYPSSCEGAISVGALGAGVNKSKSDYHAYTTIAYYSNYGEGQVDVVAPGTWLFATDSRFSAKYPDQASSDISAKQYYNGEWYNAGNGTSFASPAVAAVIGLYRSVHPDAKPAEVRQALLASCRDLGDAGVDDYYGYGLIDAERFVLGETVTVTYDWGDAAEIAPTTLSIVKGGAVNRLPSSIPTNGSLLFAGWYADAERTVPAEPLGTVADDNITFYAKWTDDLSEAELFDLRLVEPTLRMIALMQASGDKSGYAVEARVATAIYRQYPDPRTYPANRDAIREIVQSVGDAAMADLVTDTICEKTAAYAVYGYRGKSGEVTVPAEVDGIPVVAIGSRAFDGKSVTRVSLPEGLETIGSEAFRNCKKLSWIQIPTTVKEMGNKVFRGTATEVNSELEKAPGEWKKVYYHYHGATGGSKTREDWYGGSGVVKFASGRTVENGFETEATGEGYRLIAYYGDAETLTLGERNGLKLLSVEADAFRDNGTLKSLTVSPGVGPIGAGAFAECTALETVVFEGETVTLGNSAFASCTALKSVTFAGGTVTLGDAVFEACTALQSVTFAGDDAEWGEGIFRGCTALETIRIPVGLKVVPVSTFEGCSALWQAEFPTGSRLTEIASSAFADCISLSRVSLLNCTELKKIGSAFRGCTALRILTVPKTVESIAAGALRDCAGLEWLELPFAGGSATVREQGYLGYLFGATGREDASRTPKDLAVLILTGRSAAGAGMLAGLNGADVFLTETETNTLTSCLPDGNTYRFRGEWSTAPATWNGNVYADLPVTGGNLILPLEKLPAPLGVRLTDAVGTDSGYLLAGEERTFTVTFLDASGEVLKQNDHCLPGDAIEYPSVPAEYETVAATYRFLGWSHSALRVTDDLTITPLYSETKKIYTVTVRDRNSDRSLTYRLEYGAAVPPLSSYEENGWRYDFVFDAGDPTVTGNGELTGSFEGTRLTYTVRFTDGERVLDERTYHWGDTPVLPAAPTREPDEKTVYVFAGWSPQVSEKVTGNAVYTATWRTETRTYTVTFLDTDGTVLSEGQYAYGSMVKAPDAPEYLTGNGVRYRFTGWSPDLVKVTGDTTYTAVRTEEKIPTDTETDTDHGKVTETDPAPGSETGGADPAPAPGTTGEKPNGPKPTESGCASVLRMDLLGLLLCFAALTVPAFKRRKLKERRK